MAYFEKLNYSLANEDTWIEFSLMKENLNRTFCIAGSGARVLPLLAKNPKTLDVMDLSPEQLWMTELRIESARTLNYDEHLFLLGYRGGVYPGRVEGDGRYELFRKLNLSEAAKHFFEVHRLKWEPRGFVLIGKWENHFQKLGWIFRDLFRFNVNPIFEAQSLSEQRELYKKLWKPMVFRSFLRVFASEFVFNRFLYKGHFAGTAGKRTEVRPAWKFLDEEFERLFTTTLVRKSFFLQVLFLGSIRYEEGLPLEAQPLIFDKIKNSKTRVNYRTGDLLKDLGSEAYDFISLSDTVSYMKSDDCKTLLTALSPSTTGLVIIRSFLRSPHHIDSRGWTSEEKLNEQSRNRDCTGVYNFHIYSRDA